MATSFSSILPAQAAAIPADEAAPAGAAAASAVPAESAGAAAAKRADLAAVGQSLYAKLNFIFHTYPDIDELGLLLGTPPGVGKKAGTGAAETSAEEDPLSRYDRLHPPPAPLVALQSANCAPLVVLERSKLGIAFWCIPMLVRTTMLRFQQLRARMRAEGVGREQLATLAREALAEGSDSLAAQFADAGPAAELPLPLELLCCTRVLLLINADNYTAWNVRKMLLSSPTTTPAPSSTGSTSSLAVPLLTPESELAFLNLVYSKHPKSGESWSHRRWVLSRIRGYDSRYHFEADGAGRDGDPASATADRAPSPASSASSPVSLYSTPRFQSEIAMCERTAERYPKNYYAWMHRQWLVERIESREDLGMELERVGEWTEGHINDYCGFFHRQVVWMHWLSAGHTATADAAAGARVSKGDQVAQVHANLPLLLRHWSKRFPQHEFVPSAADAAAAAADSSSVAAAAAGTAPSATPTSSPSASSSSSALHASLACCSFCVRFRQLEWDHVNGLQMRYPGHESLWMYRRFVWHAFIEAIGQHSGDEEQREQQQQPSAAVGASASSSPAAVSFPSIPSWLLPLIHRELRYADQQIADRELSDAAANRVFASVYKVWVLHSALTLVYRQRMHAQASTGKHAQTASSSSFPLLPLLSPSHRTWYLSLLQPMGRFQPELMSREHWKQRSQACSSSGSG